MNDQQLFAELMRSQMLTPLQLQDLQRRHLAAMVNFAYRAVPFYRTRLAPVIGSGGFDPRRWLEVPTIDRPAVQQHVAELTPASVPSHAGLSSEKSTSGSAGRVLHLKRSALSSQFDIALTQRAYTWWRLDPRATQAVILTLNDDDPILRTEGQRAWHLSDPAGRVFALQASVPPADQVQFMRERAADYLVSQPSMAAAVAESVLRSGRPLKLQAVLTLGESLHPEQRDLFRHAFGGARAFDTYGCIEAGHMALWLPSCGA